MRRLVALTLTLPFLIGGPAAAEILPTSFESGGVELRALVHRAEERPPRALAIYLHGNPGRPLGESSAVADALNAVGVDVVRFNYRGLWGNGGEFTLTNAIGDLDAALGHLAKLEVADALGLEPAPVVLVGSSFGTAVALVGSRDDDRVAGVAALVPCDHGWFGGESLKPDSKIRDFLDEVTEALFGEGGPIAHQDAEVFVGDLERNRVAFGFPGHAGTLLDKKLLVLAGLDDRVCFVEDHFVPLYRRLRALGHPALEAQVLTMGHGFRPLGLDAVMEKVAGWVVESFPPVARTGLFLILDEAPSRDELRPPQSDESVALYDARFLDLEERPEPRFVLLRNRPDVPLRLAAPLERVERDDGRTEILIELAEDAAAEMERVTREHLGAKAAFVVDGEVITLHKIRSVISGGRIQVSRCTDDACEYLFARLTLK